MLITFYGKINLILKQVTQSVCGRPGVQVFFLPYFFFHLHKFLQYTSNFVTCIDYVVVKSGLLGYPSYFEFIDPPTKAQSPAMNLSKRNPNQSPIVCRHFQLLPTTYKGADTTCLPFKAPSFCYCWLFCCPISNCSFHIPLASANPTYP